MSASLASTPQKLSVSARSEFLKGVDLVERGFPARPSPCRISQPGAVPCPGSAREVTTAEIAPRLVLPQIYQWMMEPGLGGSRGVADG